MARRVLAGSDAAMTPTERGKWQRKDRIAQGGYRKEGDRAQAPRKAPAKKATPPVKKPKGK